MQAGVVEPALGVGAQVAATIGIVVVEAVAAKVFLHKEHVEIIALGELEIL